MVLQGVTNFPAANQKWVAVALSGAGGRVAVLNHTNPGRLVEGVIPSLVNSNSITDFAFDPFNTNLLAVACDDGKINFWNIPEGGLKQSTNTPTDTLIDLTSSDKVTVLRFHPTAKGVLAAITAVRNIVKIWDTDLPRIIIILDPHPDQIFSGSWSNCGKYFATLCRDGGVRIFEPRKSTTAILTGSSSGGGGGGRGGRLVWAVRDELIITTGFNKVSERQISVFSSKNAKLLNTIGLDVSPALLTVCFDQDTNVLLTSGKGDNTIYAHEVGTDSPHLFPLTHHKCTTVHQGLVALPKILCDVRSVEFLKIIRLTSSVLEPLSFTVPRVKTEYFQDDLFPPTRVTWEAVMTSAEWFGGSNRPQHTLSLQPPNLPSLSEIREAPPPASPPTTTTTAATNHHHHHHQHVRHQTPPFLKGMVPTEVRQTQHKLEESLSQKMTEVTTSLEQDRMEGVDDAEWED
ncbi:coronin-7-like isoform X6 [Scylla paramamosain]|uniref:coronin-7-like isoform X6 n=1 Tax=Scylla paramamosain TaxID=85552 RepID=UPI003083B73F